MSVLIKHLVMGVILGGGLGALMGYFGRCSTGGCPLTANPTRGAIYGMVMGLLFAYSFGSSAVARVTAKRADADESSRVVHVESKEEFDEAVLRAKQPVLVDFFSYSCPPCRKLGPTINELAEEYKGRAVVCKVNVDHVPDLVRAHAIRGIPAVLFFDGGKESGRIVGLSPKSHFADRLNALIGESVESEQARSSDG